MALAPNTPTITARARLHELVDALPDASVKSAARYLERATDPMIAVLDAAPWDDEPLSAEELRQVQESERAIAAGERMLTAAELEAEFEAVET